MKTTITITLEVEAEEVPYLIAALTGKAYLLLTTREPIAPEEPAHYHYCAPVEFIEAKRTA